VFSPSPQITKWVKRWEEKRNKKRPSYFAPVGEPRKGVFSPQPQVAPLFWRELCPLASPKSHRAQPEADILTLGHHMGNPPQAIVPIALFGWGLLYSCVQNSFNKIHSFQHKNYAT